MRRGLSAAFVVLLSALALTSTFDVSAEGGGADNAERGSARAREVVVPRAAGMGPVIVTCPVGLTQASYMPGLSELSKDVTVAGSTTLSSCVTIPASSVTSGRLPHDSSLVAGFSCADLMTPRTVRHVVTWNTGETSTLVFSQSRELVQGPLTLFTLTGTVESGAFAEATAIWTVTYLSSDIEKGCAAPGGLIWLGGPSTLELIRTVT